ncbi:MAG: phosphate acyltransferase, partial [Balneolaceae bacterium]
MIIAVDAVGGDHYPTSPVKGAVQAVEENEELQVILLGPEELVTEELEKYEHPQGRVIVQHAPDIVGMNDSPSQVIKTKKESSIALGLGMIKAGQCHGFVSAGNTGALLAASTFILGKLDGVLRPTISASYPTIHGIRLMLDVGANLEIRPEMYRQFAQMGLIYAEHVMGIDNPRVGLLNVGEEEEKGTEIVREAYRELQGQPNFVGNLEGRDVLFG